jgi:hypothetical protein
MEHDTIQQLINKGEAVIVKAKKGKVGVIKFKNNEVFNYNKDRVVSIKLKDYLKQVGKHTTDGFKKYKDKIIDYMRNKFNDAISEETGIITRDFILDKMIKDKIILNKDVHDLPHEANQFIKTRLTKHNRDHIMKEYGNAFEELNKGKYQYTLNFRVRVRDMSDGKVIYRMDTRAAEFKDDRKAEDIPETRIHFIIQMYYIWKDYEAIDEIQKYKIIKMKKKTNIKNMELWHIGFGKRFCNNLFKYTDDKIKNWNEQAETENYKQCVIVFLITTYHSLIDRGYISKDALSETRINEFFNSKGGFTINNLIEFVKGLKYAAICIFDPLGIIPIVEHSLNHHVINGNLKDQDFIDDNQTFNPSWYKKGLAIITANHIEGLFNDDAIQSATKNGYIKEFTTYLANDDTFDYFEDIECKLKDPDYMEFGKNNDANVLYYDDIQVSESIDPDDENYVAHEHIDGTLSITFRMLQYLIFEKNIQLTNILCDNRKSTIIGFIDPRTNKKYMRTDKDYYVRKNIINHLYNKHRQPQLIWLNQSFSQIAVLIAKVEGFVDKHKLISQLTTDDWKSYKYNNRRQAICKADNDYYSDHNELASSANDIYTLDIIKCYTSVGINRDAPFIVPNAFDTWRKFDFSTDHDIPYGEYLLKDGVYGDERTLIMYDEGRHSYYTIKYLLEMKYITYDDIDTIRPVKHTIPHDTFKYLYEHFYKLCDELKLPYTIAKMLVSTYTGQLTKLTFKMNTCLIDKDENYCQGMYNLYTENGFHVQYINHIDHDMVVLLIQKTTPNLMTSTPIWNQFIENGKIILNRQINYAMNQSPNSIVLAVNTDSFTIKNPADELIKKATEATKYKEDYGMIGQLKLEDTIKIRGKRLSEVMIRNDVIQMEIKDVNENNTFVKADGAGAGKTFYITEEFTKSPMDSRFLNPTHTANKNIENKLIEMNADYMFKRQENISVIANYFTKGKTQKEMLNPLKHIKEIFIDEFYQLSPFCIYLLYLATVQFNIKLTVAGDALQVPSPDDKAVYDLRNNDFINKVLFKNHVHLDYNPLCCRFTDDLPELLKMILTTKQIPPYFKDKVFNTNKLTFYFYLCL